MTVKTLKPIRLSDKTARERFPVTNDWATLLGGSGVIDNPPAATVNHGSLTVDDPQTTSLNGTVQTVWVAAGVAGEYCSFTMSIDVDDQRKFDQPFYFFVV